MNTPRAALFGLLLGFLTASITACGPKAPCDASTCSTGCCDSTGECLAGNTADACGVGARVCIACAASQTCSVGVCTGGIVTGGGSGGGAGNTGGGAGSIDVTLNEVATSDGDFFELINTGNATVDLSGLRVADLDEDTNGPKLTSALTLPADTTLAPGALLLFYEGDTAGASTDCLEPSVTSCFVVTFGLSASNGDSIFLVDANDGVLMRGDAPPDAHGANLSFGRIPDGTGTFVETARTPGLPNHLAETILDAGTDAGTVDDAGMTDAGEDDAGVPTGDGGIGRLTVNEVAVSQGDFIELLNIGTGTIDLSGYLIADLANDGGAKLEEALTLPAGTQVAAGEFLRLQDSTCAAPCFEFGFGLGGSGDAVFLISPTGTQTLRFDIPPTPHASGQSFGRLPDGTGHFVVTERTPGAPNLALADGGSALHLAFNEVALNQGDFVELFNTGATTIDLSGYLVADRDDTDGGVKLTEAFTIPDGTTLAPGGFAWLQDSACPDAGTCFRMGFGLSLGGGDAVFVLPSANEAPLLDLTIPPNAHAGGKSWGRLPDGTGSFTETTRSPGAANAL